MMHQADTLLHALLLNLEETVEKNRLAASQLSQTSRMQKIRASPTPYFLQNVCRL
ncbi:uncharacterized protein PHALS_14416 [Plasmopara halstedii]|uniref:Uncharacterized protein n=1 Tax=Plasmopara halstedii TaxID=4781 RepID=A0A0P1AS17_PLAHL|nr:uncharacterized protein PHALS_14416 [Plasmopara halstedii]CEG44158.1 hypothetical protein PHALS_14416 [Plasmopara halstedii]|eukprot:XP_024580527.1 hypothetical protein PHALS_14416 [Plasmopara halstedii]